MSSPFSTLEEFNGAIDGPTGGAIYTFAGSPAINNIALIVAVGLFFWFIVKTYSTSHDSSSFDRSLNHLSTFIIAGLLSLVAVDYDQSSRSERGTQARTQDTTEVRVAQSASRRPSLGLLGMMGMMGVGLPALKRSDRRRKASQRQSSQGSKAQRLANKYGRQTRSR